MDTKITGAEKPEISQEVDEHGRSSPSDHSNSKDVQEKPKETYIPQNDEDYEVT
jgi:hypothetical protein